MQKRHIPTRVLTRLGMFIAMSVILKVFVSFTITDYRFTFYDIPLMILGGMFGPVLGGLSGFLVDWINILYPNLATGFNLFTISSMLWGIIPGLLLFGRTELSSVRILFTVVFTSILVFIINTYQLYLWMGMGITAGFIPRLVTLIIKWPLQFMILEILYKRVIVYELKLLKSQ